MTADVWLMDGGSQAPPTPPRNAPAEHLATPDVTLSSDPSKVEGGRLPMDVDNSWLSIQD
jgi:hypothetical protein